MPEKPLIASHRGGADIWPENSMTAFRGTAGLTVDQMAVDQVEFDVHPTQDDVLVVHHDPTVDRMTNGSGRISELTFEAIQAFTITGTTSDRILTLDDVLAIFGPTDINLRIEIKADADRFRYEGLEEAVASAVVRHGLLERTTITAFAIDTLIAFHYVQPDVPLIWLIDRSVVRQVGDLEGVLEIARRRGVTEIALHESDLTASTRAVGQALGLRVGAYAVNDAESIQRVHDLGVTVFTTNRPDLALKARRGS